MIDRRQFGSGLASSVAVASTALGSLPKFAAAQTTTGPNPWPEYRAIVEQARQLHLATPHGSAGNATLGVEDPLPVFADLVDMLERSSKLEGIETAETDALIERAAELLRATLSHGNAPSEGRKDQSQRSLGLAARPQLSNLKREYEQLFASAQVRSKHRSTVAWYTGKLKDPDNQARYKVVAQKACAPWFFIGIIHGMEAGFNLRGHLHNGDSLKRKTVNIPRNRPAKWNPPNSWEESAVDALQHDRLANLQDWSLASMLYRFESYNGFRSRTEHSINTPYLWSFSQHYSKGKFVRDNVWSSSAVSRQCGAAVMLKMLVEEGLVTIPSV